MPLEKSRQQPEEDAEDPIEIRSWAFTRQKSTSHILNDASGKKKSGFVVKRRTEGSFCAERFDFMQPLHSLRTLPALSKWTASYGGAVHILDACLRGIGQVFFCNSPLSGLFMLVGVFASDVVSGCLLMLGVFSSTFFAYLMGFDPGLLASGIWGYNGALVGCAIALFTWSDMIDDADEPPVITVLLGVIIFASLSVIVASAIASISVPMGITPLTFPFQMASWMWLLAARRWGHVSSSVEPEYFDGAPEFNIPTYDALRVFEAVFTGIAQTFLVDKWYSGVLMLIGIALCSRISAVWAILGSTGGCLMACALGVDPEAIYLGLHGYNSCLCGMAIGGFFLVQKGYKVLAIALMSVALAEFATAAASVAFAPLGIPVLTWPFTLITWLIILGTSALPGIIPVAISSLTTAEDHMERLALSDMVTSHFAIVSQFAESRPEVSSSEDIARIEATLLPIALCAMAAAGEYDRLKQLITLGADIVSSDADLRTPLHLASAEAHLDIVRLLLENGADVNARDCYNGTPLEDAIRNRAANVRDQEIVVSTLLTYGAKLNLNTSQRLDLGHRMCLLAASGDTKQIQLYLIAGAPVGTADYDGRTAAHLAACGDNSDLDEATLRVLLEYGGKGILKLKDRFGHTPLQEAVTNGFKAGEQLMMEILKVGSLDDDDDHRTDDHMAIDIDDAHANERDPLIDKEDQSVLPIPEGRSRGSSNAVPMRQQNSAAGEHATATTAEVDESDHQARLRAESIVDDVVFVSTALHLGCAAAEREGGGEEKEGGDERKDEVAAAAAAAAAEGRNDTTAGTRSRTASDDPLSSLAAATPASVHTHGQANDMSKYLLPSLLCSAAGSGNVKSLSAMIKSDPTVVKIAGYDGRTPLHTAVERGQREVVELLLRAGADADYADRWGVSPLWSAILMSDKTLTALLIKSLEGVKPRSTSANDVASYLCDLAAQPEGPTTLNALHVALDTGGVDANAADYDRRTALHVASSANNHAVRQVLLQFGANKEALDRWGCPAFKEG